MDKNTSDGREAEWVSDRLAELGAVSGWEPHTDRAWNEMMRLGAAQMSSGPSSRIWMGIAVTAASLLLLVLVRGNSRERLDVVTPAVFTEGDTLALPEEYREWVFVGSALGLSYVEAEEAEEAENVAPAQQRPELFQNVYINPSSYRAFLRTGEFPEGTMMVLEVSRAEAKSQPGLQGRYASELVALEASVKDSSRFEGGWAYFGFTDRSGEIRQTAEPFPAAACWSCHAERAETDHVFTQFYPVLRSARSG